MSEMTPHEIEQSLERERLALAQSLAALRDRLSPATLLAEGKQVLAAQAGPLVAQVDAAVRARPMAAAVAGVALAALVLGRRQAERQPEPEPASAMAGTRFEALTRWEDEGGPPAPRPVDPDKEWLAEAVGLRERAGRLLARIDDAARRGLAPAAELAAHRAAVTAALARDTAAVLGRGLGAATGAARDRAILARERIYLRRIALAEKGGAAVGSNPVAAGLAIAAAGAAVACLFPQTEAEDRLLGEARDRLVDDIKAAVRNEVVSASDLAQTLKASLKSDLARIGSAVAPARPMRDDRQGAWRH